MSGGSVQSGGDRGRSVDPLRLADAALDGDLRVEEALDRSGRGATRAAAHVRAIRRLERLLRVEKNSLGATGGAPDLTDRVLEAVGERRGWLDVRSRRLVWGGRILAAAALLAAIGLTLSVRRAAPEFVTPSATEHALASVVSSGERAATEATGTVTRVVETIEERTPVIVRMTTTLGAEPGMILRLSGAEDVQTATLFGPRLAAVRSPAPSGFAPVSVATFRASAARVTVEAPLCPLSRHAVEAAAGVDRTPRLFRAMSSPTASLGSFGSGAPGFLLGGGGSSPLNAPEK